MTGFTGNIFFCSTPLQILIAMKVAQSIGFHACELAVLVYEKNKKYEYYIEMAAKCFSRIHEVQVVAGGSLKRFMQLLSYAYTDSGLYAGRYAAVYVGSIDNAYVQLLVSRQSKADLYTFDDGLANINRGGSYYSGHASKLAGWGRRLLGIDFDAKAIAERTLKHYTIYEGVGNITQNIQHIQLGVAPVDGGNNTKKYASIFLGQPFADLGLSERQYVELVLHAQCEYYFPHPREKVKLDGVQYIDSPLIIEDYVSSGGGLEVSGFNLYSILSTALMNLASCSNVECYAVCDEVLEKKFAPLYGIMGAMGIKMLRLK